jgi:DNA-directed RNA polymerase subunit RPC12/RpoP
MSGDFYHVLVSERCSNCGREVSAPWGELQVTGVFACICGTLTRSRPSDLEEATPFAGVGWQAAGAEDE